MSLKSDGVPPAAASSPVEPVRRWDVGFDEMYLPNAEESPDGRYVLSTDYDLKCAELAAMRERLAVATELLRECRDDVVEAANRNSDDPSEPYYLKHVEKIDTFLSTQEPPSAEKQL